MTKAIAVAFHKYTPFGDEYYAPILDFFMAQMTKYKSEFDKLYIFDSNWNVGKRPEDWVEVIQTDPNKRYYEIYPDYIHRISEDLVLFLDNDMIVYKQNQIQFIFHMLELGYDIVSIYDTIGKTFKELGGKSKFCPYLFAGSKNYFLSYSNIYWGPDMPKHETLGLLTEKMLQDGVKPYEMEEDKSNFLFGEELGERKGKDLGYYHVRAGTTPAYLLAHKHSGNQKTYWDYIKNQPKSEYLRQMAWYYHMNTMSGVKNVPVFTGIMDFVEDAINEKESDAGKGMVLFQRYLMDFKKFHGI